MQRAARAVRGRLERADHSGRFAEILLPRHIENRADALPAGQRRPRVDAGPAHGCAHARKSILQQALRVGLHAAAHFDAAACNRFKKRP